MSRSRSSLTSDAVGVIRITAGGSSFVCTALQYTMRMNNIPTATVTVGSGASLRSPGGRYQTPEDLLASVLEKRKAAYYDMVECTMEEVIDVGGVRRTTVIFKGVIVTGSPVYRAGTPTTRMIRFLCMNKVCKLYAKPLAEYVNMAGSEVINKWQSKNPFSVAGAFEHNSLYWAGKLSAPQLLNRYAKHIRDASVVDRVAAITGAILSAASYASMPEEPMDAQIKEYFFGKYRPNTDDYGMKCGDEFNSELCQYMLQSMQNASIYDALQGILTSNAYMLDLLPRWDGEEKEDFRMEIRPSEAWNPSDPITLRESDIIEIDSNYNPIACLNTPEVFIVNFSDAVEFAMDNMPQGRIGLNGVYAMNETLMAGLKKRYQAGEKWLSEEDSKRMYRTKLYTAPFWMQPAIIDEEHAPQGKKGGNSVKNELPVMDPKTEEDKEQEQPVPSKETVKRLHAIADDVAQSLFSFIYGRQDRSIVRLYPSLRFGYEGIHLENSLGKAVDIELTPDSGNGSSSANSVMNIRGILEAVQYDYTAGQAASASYTVELKCVRPLDKGEPAVPCKLYKE